jgi:hypothetical protein
MIWIRCQNKNYHDEYLMKASQFTIGKRCPYCRGIKVHPLDSIGSLYPKTLNIWSAKNDKTPFDYPPSGNSEVWWKCENGCHNDYKRTVYRSKVRDFRCAECTRERDESFLQEKVRSYITNKYDYKLNHETNCTIVPRSPRSNNKMPFDNEIPNLRLIIEVHGQQHYSSDAYRGIWGKNSFKTAEKQLKYRRVIDRYKRIIAKINGYDFLEIPFWAEKDDLYKQLIDEKITSILTR